MARAILFALLAASAAARSAPRAIPGVKATRGGATKRASESLTPGETLLAGACARMVAQSVLHPLDVIRTRSQAKSRGASTLAESMTNGLIPQIAGAGPAGAVQFSVKARAQKGIAAALPDSLRSKPLGKFATRLGAMACGTLAAGVVRVPQELVKQGCMVELYPHAGAAVATIYREKGLKGFYRGAVATVTRDVLWNSLSFATFQALLDAAAAVDWDGPEASYALGIVAGMLAACVTHPIDVAKTRVMTSTDAVEGSLFDQLAKLVDDEGWAVLAKGLTPRLLYLGPLASLVLATNEVIAGALLKARGAR